MACVRLSPFARAGAAALGFVIVAGCAATTAVRSAELETPHAPASSVPSLEQEARLVSASVPITGALGDYCARGNADVVSERLCEGPPIQSLVELQRRLGVAQLDAKLGNGMRGNASFALLSHSTSSAARLVSPINPRAFLFSSPASVGRVRGATRPNPNFLVLAFTRGEQSVELAARDRETGELRLLLVRFEQACNAAEHGCSNFDLFSPAIERDWTKVDILEDTDLANTVLDCAPCHQPSGPTTRKLLRMNELQQPWTHFFRDLDSGSSLIADYYRAHDESESYAGIAGRTIRHSQPTRLEGLVEHEGYRDQLLELPAAQIGYEMGQGRSPDQSRHWADLFRDAQSSHGLPIPAPMPRPHDDTKLQAAAVRYRAVMRGKLPREQMLSLADLEQQDSTWMSGLSPRPGASGQDMLDQMCKRCHNPSLDQSLSRARFDVPRLRELPASEREEAIARLLLPDDSPKKMPPPRFGRLSEREIALMIEALRE